MSKTPVYKVIFVNQDKVYEVFAKAIYQSELYGFVEVEEFVFGENSQMIVDPAEEKLKNEFSGVARSYIPMHSIVRIDEVEKEGEVKIVDAADGKGGGKVHAFPLPGSARPIQGEE